ncbi:MAG: putative restriction endonuclease, partial [Thermomicrobiales bacterium]|nr:putative restriction endonuclease [Thermomicrobiales bacterium]
YETGGVPEYWIADPDLPDLILFVRGADGRYERVKSVDGILYSQVLAGFSIDLNELFAELAAD